MLHADYELEEFQISRELGTGGFGITYLAFDTLMDTPVAIKEYYPGDYVQRDGVTVQPRASEEAQRVYEWGYQRFFEEAQLLAKLRHPNIVSVKRVLKANGTLYLVMEYLEGEPLSSLLEKEGKLSEQEWIGWLYALCDGLRQVHSRGILHRDIKPENIMICADGVGKAIPVFIDFGAARPETTVGGKTATKVFTPGYAPTEQRAEGKQPQGPYTDIYALACVCYEALIGTKPLDLIVRMDEIYTQGKDTMLSDLNAARGVLSDTVIDAISWGIQLQSKDRPATIDDWLAVFQGGAGAPAIQARTAAQPTVQISNNDQVGAAGYFGEADTNLASDSEPAKSQQRPLNLPLGKIATGLAAVTALGAVGFWGSSYLSEQRAEADGIARRVAGCESAISIPATAYRCFEKVLTDHPDSDDARAGKRNVIDVISGNIQKTTAAGEYDRALEEISRAADLGIEESRLQPLRQATYDAIFGKARGHFEQDELSEATRRLEHLERLEGKTERLAGLENEIDARRLAIAEEERAFAECAGLHQQGDYVNAHGCYGDLAPQFPGAVRKQGDVLSGYGSMIGSLIDRDEFKSANSHIDSAEKLGLDVSGLRKTLAKREEDAERRAQAEARARIAAREQQCQQRLRERFTYGYKISGEFKAGDSSPEFHVSAVSDSVGRSFRLKPGDIIVSHDRKRFTDISSIKSKIKQSDVAYCVNFSAGVPDSWVIDTLLIKPLDIAGGDVRLRYRRGQDGISLRCSNAFGSKITCK